MALSAQTCWEARGVVLNGSPGPGVAADAGGGGWAPLTVSTFSGSDLVVDASLNTKVTSVSHNFVAADVGTRIFITSGVGWTPGFYVINSVAANAATLASSPAATSTTGGVWAEVGVDYSQQNTVQVAIDNSTITTSIAANVITFTGYVPSAKDVGNVVHMLTGTNVTAGWYQITATGATTWTVTGAVALPTSGTTTNATGNMGGALLTLTAVAAAMVASNKAFVTGAFTTTATISMATTGATPSGATAYTRIIGYGTTRGDATHATLTLSTNTGLTGITANTCTGFSIEQVDVDCGSLGTSTGIALAATANRAANCKVSNFTTAGITLTGPRSLAVDCEVTAGTAAATAGINGSAPSYQVARCFVHDNACTGIKAANAVSLVVENLVANNTGASSHGIISTNGVWVLNNTVHGNGGNGISNQGSGYDDLQWRNNIVTNNGGVGILFSTSTAIPAGADYDGNAYGGGASANTGGTMSPAFSVVGVYGIVPYTPVRDVTLSASPYVGGTTGTTANFALNNVSGGGAACRKAGTPGLWPGNTGSTGYLDFGAVQTASGGGVGIIVPV